jgi:glutathione peroxidase
MRNASLPWGLGLLVSSAVLGCPYESPPTDAATPTPAPVAGGQFVPNEVVVDHEVAMLDGSSKSLSDYRGKALLVVNTASECGFTPQYAELQRVYAQYRDRGLEVLAFPSNDFGGQEPGDGAQIREFVDDEFSVEFPMFDKVHATGPEISPVYQTLSQDTGDGIRGEVKWNFTKFLVDPQGRVVARFEPPVKPTDPALVAAIESVLPAS